MDEVSDKHKDDSLACWWWPGQWLRIVWSAWVDQEWYWQNVQLKLNDRRRAWGVFAQSVFGATFVVTLFLVPLIIVSGSVGNATRLSLFIAVAVTGVIMAFGMAKAFAGAADEGVAFVSLFVPAYVIPRFIQGWFLQGFVGQWVGFLFLCIAFGLAYGVYEGISRRTGVSINVTPVVIALIVNMPSISAGDNGEYGSGMGFFLIVIELATAVLLGGASAGLGLRWVTRKRE